MRSKKLLLALSIVFIYISGCSTNNSTPSNGVSSKIEPTGSDFPSPHGKGTLVAYYPHNGSLLKGFTWFQPFIINGKNAGNIQPKKHIACHLAPGTYTISTTLGGFGLPNSLRKQANQKFTVTSGKTTYVQFNVNKGAYSSSVQISSGSKAVASTTQKGGKCAI